MFDLAKKSKILMDVRICVGESTMVELVCL